MTVSRGRKRISQACLPCSKRKTRCDGSVPICQQCQSSGRECRYGFSKRNKTQKGSKASQPTHASLLLSEPIPNIESSLQQSSPNLLQGQTYNNDREATPWLQSASIGASNEPSWSAGVAISPTTQRVDSPSKNAVIVGWDISKRLFDAYFAYIHPVWPILYKPLYDCSDYRSLSESLPQPVLYAVYSIAACLKLDTASSQTCSESDVPHPSLFFEAALLSIQRNANSNRTGRLNYFHPLHLLRPSVENCQALTILALQQHGFAEPANAFMLCSLASAMAIELELHKAKRVNEDATQAQIASRLWWNVFVLDKMIACELGRPCMLRSEDSNAHLPSTSESDEYQLLQFHLRETNSLATTKSYTLSGFNFAIKITKIMEKVARQIYSLESRETIKNDLQAGEEIRMGLSQELQDYYTSLTAYTDETKLDVLGKKAISPAFVTNAVWCWTMMILVHRPFYSYWQTQNWLPGQSLPPESQPLELSFSAAEKICQILEVHVENLQRFPCDLIFPIFTTASTLAHYRQVRQGAGAETTITERLTMCVKWLSILGGNWKNAGKSKSKLTKDLDIGFRHEMESNAAPSVPRSPQPGASASTLTHDLQNTSSGLLEHSSLDPEELNGSGTVGQTEYVVASTDWAFLDKFGDANDEFYAMDTHFRNFLGTGLRSMSDDLVAVYSDST